MDTNKSHEINKYKRINLTVFDIFDMPDVAIVNPIKNVLFYIVINEHPKYIYEP